MIIIITNIGLAFKISNNIISNTSKMSKSSNKLSTGLNITNASDDSAGLAISEKMKAQIRGLNRAQRNIQDGISLVQVTEGALGEIESMAHRIRELGVQAANETLSSSDRENIQVEINQLVEEMDEMSKETMFNGIKVLQGKEKITIIKENTIGGMPSWVNVPTGLNTPVQAGSHATAEIDFSALDNPNTNPKPNVSDLLGQGFYSTCCTCTEKYSIKFVDTNEVSTGSPNPVIMVNISGVSTAEDLVKEIVDQSKPYLNHFTEFYPDPNDPKKLIIYDNRPDQKPDIQNDRGIIRPGYIETITKTSDPDIFIQSGPNEDNITGIHLPKIDVNSTGLSGIDVSNVAKSQRSIRTIDSYISYLNTERAMMGSYNNRLDVKNNIASIMETNLTSANSKITDVDMAKEIVKLSRHNILQQSSMSILSNFKNITESSMKALLQ